MAKIRVLCGLALLLAVFLIGCAGAQGGTPKATVEGIPTPQAVFAQATTIITPVATPATANDADLAAGQRVYEAKCASCHGAKGEGVEGKGKGVASWTMSASDFDDLLRTGNKGKLGNDHLYGPSQISPSGIGNLYIYVGALQKK